MRENRVLYQIKDLEKLVIRVFVKDIDNPIKRSQFPCHITPTQVQIIEYILDNPDKEIYQKDLENVLDLRRATVSGVLQTMEKNGLLEREVHTNDARCKKIILNDKTRKIFSQKRQKFNEIDEIITKNISDEELNTFSRVLDKMKENIKNNY